MAVRIIKYHVAEFIYQIQRLDDPGSNVQEPLTVFDTPVFLYPMCEMRAILRIYQVPVKSCNLCEQHLRVAN